jgi:hypothetical protein
MKVQWKKMVVKITVWVAAEIILNLIGLDNLANYTEFVYEQDMVILTDLYQIVIVRPPL